MNETTAVIIRLVDGDGLVYDVRGVDAASVPLLNARANEGSDGELWWEEFDPDTWHTLLNDAADWVYQRRVVEFFDDAEAAQRFAQLRPDWRVFLTLHASYVVAGDDLTPIDEGALVEELYG